MTAVLLVAAPGAPDLALDLAAVGIHVRATSGAPRLVGDVAGLRPDLVVAWEPHPADSLLPALADLQRHAPVPVVLFTTDATVETLEAALHIGVHALVVNGYAAARLRPLIQLAQARFARDRARQREFDALRQRYDERKLVDRAKGILMRTRQVGEDEAFRLLRDASMRRHERVGSLSQRLIDAARDAEVVNRAGLLRMLSQQLVKLHALRGAGVDSPAWRDAAARARRRASDAIDMLGRTLSRQTWGDLTDDVERAWRELAARLDGADERAALPAADAAAESLLQAAERLATALEASSPFATLAVVNLAGRQRMLSQRLAKQALLATLLEGDAADAAVEDAATTIAALRAAQRRLREAPLSSDAIRADLDEAERLLDEQLAALRAPASRVAAAALGDGSEALLAVFERLVARYEQGAQALLAGD